LAEARTRSRRRPALPVPGSSPSKNPAKTYRLPTRVHLHASPLLPGRTLARPPPMAPSRCSPAGDDEDSSASDRDDSLDEDMEALRRACMITGSSPGEFAADGADGDSSESEDDLDLLRSIQERFSVPSSVGNDPPIVKPLNSILSMESDEEDDFETLRGIQRRFVQYERDSIKTRYDQCSHEAALCGISALSEQDTSDLLFSNRGVMSFHQDYNISAANKSFMSTGGVTRENRGDTSVESQEVEDRRSLLTCSLPMHSRFPKCAQTFVDALKRNRSCQKFIRAKLIEIEAKIEQNKALKERVKCLMDFHVASGKRANQFSSQKKDPRVKLISLPKLRMSSTSKANIRKTLQCGPPENSHVSKYKSVLSRFPVSLSKQPWSKAEKENLSKGIKQQYQERVLLNTMESDLEGTCGNSAVTLSNSFEFSPEDIRSFLPVVNWERVASMYLPGRSGVECESRCQIASEVFPSLGLLKKPQYFTGISKKMSCVTFALINGRSAVGERGRRALCRWLNIEDPLINHSPWTILEEKKLLHIVQDKGIYNWIDIAVSLGTSRTPFQCLVRYQRSLNPCILKKDWTKDEDAQLRAAVETFGVGDWQQIASCMEGRTGPQCSNRWRKCLIGRKVGRWSVHEDKRLKVAVPLFGAKNWNIIAQFISGRTQVQCRERWVNCLDPSLNLKAWTEEEDVKLTEAIAKYGCCWSKVASFVPPRTDNQCWRRWKVLFRDEVPLRQASWKMQKAVLITNFVDRESERPLIGPGDFCHAPGIHSNGDVNVNNDLTRKKKMSDLSKHGGSRKSKVKGSSKEHVVREDQPVGSQKHKVKEETFKENATLASWLQAIRHKRISKKRKNGSGKQHEELVLHTCSEGSHESSQPMEGGEGSDDVCQSDAAARTSDMVSPSVYVTESFFSHSLRHYSVQYFHLIFSTALRCSATQRHSYSRRSKDKAKSFLEKLIKNGLQEPSVQKTNLTKRKRSDNMTSDDYSSESSWDHNQQNSRLSMDTGRSTFGSRIGDVCQSSPADSNGCSSAPSDIEYPNLSSRCKMVPTLENSIQGGHAILPANTKKMESRSSCVLLPNGDGLSLTGSIQDETPRKMEVANVPQPNLERTRGIIVSDCPHGSLCHETEDKLGLQDDNSSDDSSVPKQSTEDNDADHHIEDGAVHTLMMPSGLPCQDYSIADSGHHTREKFQFQRPLNSIEANYSETAFDISI
ncbi:hypothetical protein Taro_011354, partial [Colocasia esculenta]|nr:hypothetical protein [Colocasia esculenta]